MNNDNLKNLWNTLRKSGYNPPSFDQFAKDMEDEDNLRRVHGTLKAEGYTPPEFDVFKSDMGFGSTSAQQPPSSPQQKITPTGENQNEFTESQIAQMENEATVQATSPKNATTPKSQGTTQNLNLEESELSNGHSDKMSNIGRQATDALRRVFGRANSRPTVKSAAEMARQAAARVAEPGIIEQIGDKASSLIAKSQKDYMSEVMIANLPKDRRREVLTNKIDDVFDEQLNQKYDAETIAANKQTVEKMRSEFRQKMLAEAEPQYDKLAQMHSTNVSDERKTIDEQAALEDVDIQLKQAYEEKERIEKRADEIWDAAKKEYDDAPSWARWGSQMTSPNTSGGSKPSMPYGLDSNKEFLRLEAASQKIDKTIRLLEDKKKGRMNDFWNSFGNHFQDVLDNYSVLSNPEVNNISAYKLIPTIEKKRAEGQPLTKEEEAAESMLRAEVKDNLIQSLYSGDYGTWAKAGMTAAGSLEMMADFAFGMKGFMGIAKGGVKFASKKGSQWFGKQVMEKWLPRHIVKGTGALAGTTLAGAAMTNTIWAPKVVAKTMEHMNGDLTIDENGKYKFVDQEEFVPALFHAERELIPEAASEFGGEFFPSVGGVFSKGLKKIGLSKIANGLTRLSGTQWYKNYTTMLKQVGFHGLPGEAFEEYAGTLYSAMLGDLEGIKSLADPDTHVDIWLGTVTVWAMMNAPRIVGTGYRSAQYYRYKNATEKADMEAGYQMSDEVWNPLRDRIDEATNEEMKDVVLGIITDDNLSEEGKKSALEYVNNLQKMRGYNIGLMAAEQGDGEEESSTSEPVEEINSAYQEGYSVEDVDERKAIIDEANEAEAVLRQQFAGMPSTLNRLLSEDADPVEQINITLLGRGDVFSDQEIASIMDYYIKRTRALGVMEAAADDVDFEVAKANAEVNCNTHKQSGQLIEAVSGDESFFIVGGNVELTQNEDGYDFVLSGTGDALIVRNVETGEISVKAPLQMKIIKVSDPNVSIQENETTLRQQLMEQHNSDLTFGSPANEEFQLDDTVVLNDGHGNVFEGEIGMMPSSADSSYVVYTTDGRALPLTADQLNRMIVEHNGIKVQRASSIQDSGTVLASYRIHPESPETAPESPETAPESPETAPESSEAVTEEPQEPEPQQSALDKIPVLENEKGEPILNRKGRKQYQWHKASVEDTADAMIEITGGDMLEARDTATDMTKQARSQLEKIRKQTAKGSDPIEIAESRANIRRQEQEQQAIIKHWQDVNLDIQRRMREEEQRKRAEIEAAKSEAQRAAEAEQRRQEQERQEQLASERRRQQIEEDLKNWNKPYQPLEQARRDMASDNDAMAILNDTEPRGLDEWVSSLLRPQSIMWNDIESEGRTIAGLQSELGLSWNDMRRFGALIGGKGKGLPFGQVVHEIWEGLPDGLKEQYDDQDVRNTLLDLFNERDARRMRNLAAEHRIEEARQLHEENLRRDEEAEMEAWAEANHLNPEEREAFEDFLQQEPYYPEEQVINQIILENEKQNTGSQGLDINTISGRNVGEGEGGQSQVQTAVEANGGINTEEEINQVAEAAAGESPVPGNNVPEGARGIDRESLLVLFDQIGADTRLADRMSDYEVEQLTAMVDDWDEINAQYGQVMEEQKEALQSKNKAVRDEAQAIVDEAQAASAQAFEPIAQYIEGLNAKYGIDSEEPFEGAIPTPSVDNPRYEANRQALVDAYKSGDPAAITAAAQAIQQYIDEGLNAGEDRSGIFDTAEEYDGNDPEKLADQYIIRTFWDRYLDNDEDQEYIKTGLKASMREKHDAYQVGQSFEIVDDYGERRLATVTDITDNGITVDIDGYGPMSMDKETVDEYRNRPANSSAEQPTSEGGSLSSNLGKTSSSEEILAEEAKVDTNPTDAQKEAGNYQKGHIKVDGYDITIENPKGSVRRGTDANGQSWEVEMHNTYGYIRGTEGVDGDHIDVFLSDEPTSGKVFVVDQVNSETGDFDEHKVMYGFASEEEARAAYLSNYSPGWKGLGAITEVTREEFKKWVESSHRKTKPFAEYKSMKKSEKRTKADAQPKRLVSDERMEQLKERLRKKLGGQLNVGVDPEVLAIGAEMAIGYIERGITKFADYAKAMIEEVGDFMRPYLKSFYNAVRDMPEAQEYAGQMDDYQTVSSFDVFGFDKQKQPSVIEKAEQVVKEQKVSRQTKKIKQEQPSLFDDLFAEQPAAEQPKQTTQPNQEPVKRREPKLRPATEADLEGAHPIVYLNGHPWNIIAVMRSGEQISATQFSEPKVDSVMLTNGKSVKLEELMVEDKNASVQPKRKTAWWNDAKRPQSLDPSDYHTYTTDEAKAYFEQFKSDDGKTDFTKWAHPNLAYITAAAWDGAIIPVEELMQVPEIQEAEARIKSKKGSLNINENEQQRHVVRLLDAEHGSAVFENGKIKKVNGEPQFTGPVRQEHKAFIVIGLPAGGKSSVFANPLSYENGARIIDSDVVKPWLNGYDEGYGAGYVQMASARVADMSIMEAAKRGDNMVIPRIGGDSVIKDVAIPLREMGYDVQLYWNDVSKESSIMRATSRFAEEGRYLSLAFLTNSKRKDSKTFSTFAEKKLGDYYAEREGKETTDSGHSVSPSGNVSDVLDSRGSREGNVGQAGGGAGSGVRQVVQGTGERGESERGGTEVLEGELIFSYAEWKSNDVAFGEKPKEIWNSESGKPMPIKKGINDDARDLQQVGEENRRGSDRVSSGKSSVSRSANDNGLESDLQERRDERKGDTGVSQSDGAVSSSTSGQLRPVQGLTQQQPAHPKQASKHNNKRNNSGERGKDYAPTSPKARFNANVQAIKMMRELIDQGIEAPTKDQMEVLRQYSGWGGLGTYFNDESSAENKILRDLLDDEEYKAAALSIKTAYYTPAYIIDSLWDIAKAIGFKGGSMLEGSAGIGNIIAQMPRDLSRQSDIEAVEIDKITGNILKLLYPDAKVHIQGFQDAVIRNGSVDLAITNVPFAADLSAIDKVDKDLSRRFKTLHDFCIAKNIRKLREGGLGIFITSSGTLDKSTDLRAWITDEGQADVVGAFRLNNETFGGAKVTSDIIVVRKRIAGRTSEHSIDVAKASPLRVGTYEDKYGDEHQATMVINDYFKEHPEMMAGEMAFAYEKGDTYRPGSYGLYPVTGMNQEKMMTQFVKSMKEVGAATESQQTIVKPQTEAEPNQLTAVKEGRMLIDDNGRICVSRYGEAVPLGLNDQKVKGQTKQQCFKDYQAVQAAVDEVLQQQLNDPNDEALKPKLAALNKAYDLFTKRYGTLHKNTAISFLRNDIDFPSFQALELYREEKDINGKVKVITSKPKLFSERVIGFKTEPQPKTVKDAVIASIFRTNGIDLDWIAEKLGKNTDAVRSEILDSRLGFEDPSTGQLEIRYRYLSGNVREKLAIAEQYNAEGETAGRYAANVEELRKAVPMDIPAHLIDFSLGSSWIPVELYKDFVKETLDLGNVRITHLEGNWAFDEGYSFRNEKNRSAGVYSEKFRETIYGHQLVAAALNNRPYKVSKQVTEGWGASKTTHTEVDQAATQACNVRIDEIKDEFRAWTKKKMQDDPELARRIEKIYNDKFNALVPMEIGDEFLPDIFEGANQTLPLYAHQKRGALRGITSPTMLAHEVGTGKSFTLITTAMEMRRLGTAKKPMIVVQNATVAQMTADAKLLYPNARVLSLSEQDRDAEGRRAFYAKIKYNDWDIIIVPQSTFERIPDSPERELQFIQEKIDEKKHVIEAAQAAGVDNRDLEKLKRELEKIEQEYGDKYLDSDPINNSNAPKRKKKDAKREAASLDKAETRAKEQLDRATDDVQFFDDLGVDALLVDEAHEYKHLGFQTSMGRGIKGIDPSYSKKCAGLYNKTRSVFEKAGWKNIVFATGTPISNTAAEIWTFMRYLMPVDVMKANDIYYFDDFVHNFGNVSQMLEFTTSGKFKENTRFAAYVNKPELIRIWSQVADTVLTKEVAKVQDKIPEEEGGKDQDVFLPQSPSLIRIMAAVRAELERFENMTGQEKKENSSIPLTMYGIAKRAAIDPRLVDAEAPDEPLSKTNAAVKEILKDLKATQSYKGTVAVFCDNQNRLGTNATGKKVVEFNIYDDMKEKLIKAGVPEKQIAIIKSGMSITAKQKIFDAVNSGDIRVVLGSTQTLGTGVNMQERLHLLIHMDAPDRPMDYTQRNGRIKRQGNLHKQWGKTIRVVRFGVEDSLDVTAYQRLKTKSGFIDSIMDGKAALADNQTDRTVEEEEEGLFDNPVAVLSGSQYALKKNQAERELRKYQGKKSQWEADQIYITNQLRHNANEVNAYNANIDNEQKTLEKIKGMFPDGTVKTITIEGVKIDMTRDDGAKKLGEVLKEKINDPVNAIVKRNRENAIYNDETLLYTISLDGHDIKFTVQVQREAVWENGKMKTVIHKFTSYSWPELNMDSMESARGVRDYLDELLDQVVTGRDSQDRIDAMQQAIERTNKETEQIKKRVGMPFQFDKELAEAQKNVDEYTELMRKEMEEKEAKYAAQQKEAGDAGGFDLHKAEDNEDDDLYSAEEDWDDVTPEMKESVMQGQPMFRGMEQFAEGERFPIHTNHGYSSYNVLDTSTTYSTDLIPEEYGSRQQMLDAIRRQYPAYYAHEEDGQVVMESWRHVLNAADTTSRRKSKGQTNYINRKTRNAVNAIESRARLLGLDVEILTTTEGLTGKKARAKGWFNQKTGKIVLVLPNHSSLFDLDNTLMHEGVAHFGLRKMFGPHFYTFLDNVYNNVSPEIKRRIDAAIKRNGWSRHEATEEYLARLAESTDFDNAMKQGWWQKIKDFFVNMLAKVGLIMEEPLSDNELRYILWRSYDNLLHPNSRRSIFDNARDTQMQSRLRVGRHSERERQRLQRTGRIDTSQLAAELNMASEELLNRTAYSSIEVNDIIEKAKANGTFMKAPNGKPSNLNELQWAQVRTKAFKDWFGDWENDPEHASKVVDENGEPKVMYHSTNLEWVNKGEPFWVFYEDSHFGTKGQADDRLPSKEGVKTYEVFLNIRNPQRRQDADQDYLDDRDMTMSEYWQLMSERSRRQGYDGIVYLNEYEDREHPADSWMIFDSNQVKSATDNSGDFSTEDNDIRYSIRTKEPPKKTGIGYKVFVLKDGQLYPPMVANPNGEGTPVGVWLDADAAPVAGTSKTGRPQVKAGGKGTQGGSGQLAYRPGWHLGTIPYALQFGRKDANGERTLFPNNFVWAEVEYADDVDYQEEARQEGINANGKYQHSLAGLKHVPTDGSYKYRTNPDPRTDEWIITGAMRVTKVLTRKEVEDLVRQAGREPQQIQDGDVVTDEAVKQLNDEIQATMEADDMGLLFRDDTDIAQNAYNEEVAKRSLKLAEAWQDSMAGLKAIQDAIAKETGKTPTGTEDAYLFENRMHGRAKNMTEQYDYRYYRPMLKAFSDFVNETGLTQQQGLEYLISKHGLERNMYYAFRDGMKAKIADEVKEAREQLDKDYAKGRVSDDDYKAQKADLEERERSGVDDAMQQVTETYAYKHAKDEYKHGNINYGEYLRILETVIRGHLQRANPKKDSEGNIVSDNYYDENVKDFSGLTETLCKEMYDAAQNVKRQAQKAIDKKERRELWSEYDKQMRQAYITARQLAEDAVFGAESSSSQTANLWEKINAATKETLRHSYESGMIERSAYNKVREMFDFYIPLRGWEENKASDVYTYMGRDNVFSPAVKKTWGRTSKAENPLAYIGNIAVSTILAGHRNQMKQRFLNYVMNNPTSLVSISESWYENIGTEDSPIWILRSADTAGKSADEIVQIINDFNEEMQQKQSEGLAMPVKGRLRLDVNATKGQKAEHVVEVQRAGHTYQLYINGDPKAAQALNGTLSKAVSRISDTFLGKAITNLNRNMAAFFTSKNPAFVISNLSRDLNMAGASVAIKEGAEYNARFIYNVARVLTPRLVGPGNTGNFYDDVIKYQFGKGRGVTGMMPKLMRKWRDGNLDTSDETERLFKEFMDEGGETGFVNMLSIDSFKRKMQKEIVQMNGSTLLGSLMPGRAVKEATVKKGLRLLGDTFEFYNRCAEDATRFIVYMTSRQMGKTLEASIDDAKNVTLNFNRKGTGGLGNAEIRDLFIFVNPAIQALSNMYKMMKGKPLKFGAVTAAFVAGGGLMPVINQWLLNMFGDDDDKDSYWNLPTWVRKNNLVFWLPGTKNFVTIPLAQEFRVFYGIGEMIGSAMMSKSINNPALEVFSSVADLVPINPTGNGGNLLIDFSPTFWQPLAQIGSNVDFTGRPIWRENQGNKYAPMYTKAYVSTPKWMVRFSEILNKLTGGNEGKKGVVEQYAPFWGDYLNNPAVWNHLLQGYFGGMYNTIAKAFDVGVTVGKGEVPKIYQTPVVNRFLNRPVERDNGGILGEDYYALIQERNRTMYEVRTWKKKVQTLEGGTEEHEEAGKKYQELIHSKKYKRAEIISYYERIIRELKSGEKAIKEGAAHEDDDMKMIHDGLSMYKQSMMEELDALDGRSDQLQTIIDKFDSSKNPAERNKLRLRIERMTQDADGKTVGQTSDVEKALAYIRGEETESADAASRYLSMVSGEDVVADARIRKAKARIKEVTDEYKRLLTEDSAEAAKYRKHYAEWFMAEEIIKSAQRAISTNKKLLGKGFDAQIMKLIAGQRQRMLKAIEGMD